MESTIAQAYKNLANVAGIHHNLIVMLENLSMDEGTERLLIVADNVYSMAKDSQSKSHDGLIPVWID